MQRQKGCSQPGGTRGAGTNPTPGPEVSHSSTAASLQEAVQSHVPLQRVGPTENGFSEKQVPEAMGQLCPGLRVPTDSMGAPRELGETRRKTGRCLGSRVSMGSTEVNG